MISTMTDFSKCAMKQNGVPINLSQAANGGRVRIIVSRTLMYFTVYIFGKAILKPVAHCLSISN